MALLIFSVIIVELGSFPKFNPFVTWPTWHWSNEFSERKTIKFYEILIEYSKYGKLEKWMKKCVAELKTKVLGGLSENVRLGTSLCNIRRNRFIHPSLVSLFFIPSAQILSPLWELVEFCGLRTIGFRRVYILDYSENKRSEWGCIRKNVSYI